jgi:hypothetical protein
MLKYLDLWDKGPSSSCLLSDVTVSDILLFSGITLEIGNCEGLLVYTEQFYTSLYSNTVNGILIYFLTFTTCLNVWQWMKLFWNSKLR